MKKLTSFWMLLIAVSAFSLLVSGCASLDSGGNMAQRDMAQGDAPLTTAGTVGSAAADGGPAVQPDRGISADYRIAPRDILQISVFQVQDLNNAVQVNEDGTVTLPLVGKAQVSGRTTSEAEQILTARFRKYLQSPQVSVSVKTYGNRITISGEVKTPRVVADDGNTTLSQAVADAGGLSELGDSSRVHVARSINGHVRDEIHNLDDIQAGKAKDPLLRGGDIVVPESSQSKVVMKGVRDLLPFAMLGALF